MDKLKALEKLVEEKDSLITILANKMKIIEEKLFVNEVTDIIVTENPVVGETVEKLKCDLCEYESNSERGIHINKKKKLG